jgi:hypothetical protein
MTLFRYRIFDSHSEIATLVPSWHAIVEVLLMSFIRFDFNRRNLRMEPISEAG